MDGLRRFGIADTSKSLLAVKLVKSTDEESYKPFLEFLKTNIQGTQVRVSNEAIENLCDFKIVKKVWLIIMATLTFFFFF